MKKLFLFFLILVSCKQKIPFYDLEGPIFNFFIAKADKTLFQFNEPLSLLKFFIKENPQENFIFKPKFCKANFLVDSSHFVEKEGQTLVIEAYDTSKNCSLIEIPVPIVNTNPAFLNIKEFQLKYSKKKNQFLILKSCGSGNTSGFSLVFFIKNKKVEVPFKKEDIKNNDELKINFGVQENVESQEISFSKKNITIYQKGRLPQTNSFIYIKDNNGQIIDYILYYNSKNKNFEKYKQSKNAKQYIYELKTSNIEAVFTDINGNSSKKTIIKSGNKFVIKK